MSSNRKIHVLLIEDEEFDVKRIQKTILPFRDRINIREIVSNGHSAIELLEQSPEHYDVIIMDYQIAGRLTGENLIRRIKKIDSALQIIIVTKMTINMTDCEFANSLLEAGAAWYCTKYPGDIEDYIYQPTDFLLSIFNAFEKKKLEEEKTNSNNKLQKNVNEILHNKQLIGNSAAVQKLNEQIQQCADTDTNVIIRGPSGTGKELVATNIHYLSKRKFENFIPINCGSLPHNLIESELFGYEKGSFTGADTKKLGLFEVANNGTIFLDEITELSLSTQSTLLRVIQEGEIDKIGRTQKVKVNVRIIAATNQDLEKELHEKRFREDLYYRLNVVSIFVPSLAQRREDILLLIQHFMNLFSQDMNRQIPEITERGMDVLVNYHWPGNVRELQNVVQRLLFINEDKLNENHVKMALGIPPDFRLHTDSNKQQFWNSEHILPWPVIEHKIRKEYFQFVRDNSPSDAEAARKLGIAPPNYHRMCKELGLK